MEHADLIRSQPEVVAAFAALEAARGALGGGRWGETRRFAGRAAGNRLARIERAERRVSRAWDRAEKRLTKEN